MKNITTITTLYLANSYAKGCPSNSRGRQSGVGLTKKQAIRNCQPWANQAPWFRPVAKKVFLIDGSGQNSDLAYKLLPEEAQYYCKIARDSEGAIIGTELIPKDGELQIALAQKKWSKAIKIATELKII